MMKMSLGLASAPVVKEGRQTLPSGYLLQVFSGIFPQLQKNISALTLSKETASAANAIVAIVLDSIPASSDHGIKK